MDSSLSTARRIVALGAIIACFFVADARAQATFPDVIVASLPSTSHYGPVNGVHSYAVGTTSCNIGTDVLLWISNTNEHPVITQNVYRVANNRFEQIGQGWLKHGFCALSGTLCGPCATTNCDTLGVGCSDPYSSGLNGSQGGLGPKSDINPSTGFFTMPFTGDGQTGATNYKRIQVQQTDLEVPGARYFVASHYVTADEPPFDTDNNNESFREVEVQGNFDLDTIGSTQQQMYAVEAWKFVDPTVNIMTVDVPMDGRFVVAAKAVQVNGTTWRYEYAVQNYSSDRAGGGFSVPIPAGAVISNVSFKDVDYHSGEIYDNTDWTSMVTATDVTWSSPATHAVDPDSNALRWDTVYNFSFECDSAPQFGDATITLFKPGTPTDVSVTTRIPGGVPGAPSNDDCAGGTTAIAGTTSFFSDLATTDGPSEAGCPNFQNDVWFRYVAPCDGDAVFATCGSSFDTQIAVYTDCSATSALGCNNDTCGLQSEVTVPVLVANEYWIRIGGNGDVEGSGSLTVTDPNCPDPTPLNNDCANAIQLADGVPVNGTTVDATNDGTATCASSSGSNDVWYTYTPTISESVEISTCNMANYDTALAIFDGCSGTQLACQDDASGCSGFTTRMDYLMTAGTTYWIRVSGYNNAFGDFTIEITGGGGSVGPMGPLNDDCANRQGVGLGQIPFDTTGATTDGPTHAACDGSGDSDVGADIWFNYPSTFYGQITVSLCGSSFDTRLAVYDGNGCTDFENRLMECNDDSCSTQSQVTVDVVPGRNYTIRVGGYNDATGDGTLEITGMMDPCPLITNGLVMQLESGVGLQTSGANVTGWTDSSGEGNDLAAVGSPTLEPAAIGGLDAVSFDGVDDGLMRLAGVSGVATGNADRTIIAIVRYDAPGFGGIGYGDSACGTGFGIGIDDLGTVGVDTGCATTSGGSAGVGTGWLLHSAVVESGNLSQFKNGALVQSGPVSLLTLPGQIRVGSTVDATEFGEFAVAAIYLYDRALTPAERGQMEDQLKFQYFSDPCDGNNPPVANPDIANCENGEQIVVNVVGNDLDDASVDPATVQIFAPPSSGMAVVDPVTGDITYTHDGTATTEDAFSYTVLDADGAESNIAVVDLTIDPCSFAMFKAAPNSAAVCVGEPFALSVMVSSATPVTLQWYVDGQAIGGATADTYSVATATLADAGDYDVIATNACGDELSGTGIVTVAEGPSVTSDPVSELVCEGDAVLLSGSGSGPGTLTYQWLLDGSPVAGGDAPTLSIPSVDASTAGTYALEISNGCSTVQTAPAVVTLDTPTVVSQSPVGGDLCVGDPVMLSVTATGAGTLDYIWRKNGTPIMGASGPSLTIASATVADAGAYDVVVAGDCGLDTSAAAIINVTAAPEVTSVTGPATGCVGASVTFNVVATGNNLTYQWSKDGSPVMGEINPWLTLPAVALGDAGSYSVEVFGDCGSETSSSFAFAVDAPPSFTTDPQGTTVCEGADVMLSATAISSTGATTYQWQRAGSPMMGETSATLALTDVSVADAGDYTVIASNACGDTVSAPATLVVDALPQIDVQPAAAVDICEGFAFMVDVQASGDITGYQWLRNGSPLAGETSSALVVAAAAPGDAGSYTCEISSGCGDVVSAASVVTVEAQADCDCNGNLLLDEDELLAGGADCNLNGILDECDIANGTLDVDLDGVPDECQDVPFLRGDVNQDGDRDLGDPISLLSFLFAGTMAPGCVAAADVNDDDGLGLQDAITLLSFLFSGGTPPPAPTLGCGVDPTPGTLTCDSYSACP